MSLIFESIYLSMFCAELSALWPLQRTDGLCIRIGEDNYFDVFTSVSLLCAEWHKLCLALGLPHPLLSKIKKDQAGDTDACLHEGLTNWLRRNYNTEKHGLPTWRRLVEAVGLPSGGNNHALALKIAKEHKSKLLLYSGISHNGLSEIQIVSI